MSQKVPFWRAATVSLLLLTVLLMAWEYAVLPVSGGGAEIDPEYAALLGQAAAQGGTTPMPGPSAIWKRLVELMADPFYVRGTNDQGIGVQIAYSLLRVGAGFGLAAIVAIPLGFLIGMSPLLNAALNPFIQVLRPVSPLAWMPLALYSIKDSAISAVFVIFICSIWPMLLNTAFGVASVRKEWLNVARTLEAGTWKTATRVILPAAAPTIVTGMRISIGIAWLVIVAAEMLVGGTGIGYWVWNQWNNLSIADIVIAILMIGLVGLALDRLLGLAANAVAWRE
ncbi:nitrate ABC transporter permease [Neoroseomonas oryzicola]|uniref:Nitrate ABC transporter permease n=1 Tax=Neoroseomonas oryzicola TaxID=535904 RepID=A0A9X9WEK4_9PROT|nr:nitrate ABC transporter permease [Neoroseomonas oryzicola]MBR0658764.1 nitrate ABC transporter permease [Neoroseomonas oryzicola]NKE17242.1 nitrate ABC transporter permease [Neoroseomonas oryzicola]